MRHLLLAILGLASALMGPLANAAEPLAVTYVRAGKLLDIRSGKMLRDQVIVQESLHIE